MRVVVFIFCILTGLINHSYAQNLYEISGKITDKQTGEPLVSASIAFMPGNIGCVTNPDGIYKLSLPDGFYYITISYLGYQKQSDSLMLNKSIIKNYRLETSSVSLTHIDINAKADNNNVTSNQPSSVTLKNKEITQLPSLFGESDVLKAIRLTPGIQAGGEGNQGLFVRGGDAGQNLVLFDGMTIYNPTHMMGFFSVFNSDAVESIQLIKGGMPSQYGGRASSAILVGAKEGNYEHPSGSASMGFLSSDLTIESPFGKSNGSVIISGRRAYLGLIRSIVNKLDFKTNRFFKDNRYYFYDINGKVSYKLSSHDRLYLSGYYGNDNYRMDKSDYQLSTHMKWGNRLGSLRCNHIFNSSFSGNQTIGYSGYNFNLDASFNQYAFHLSSKIEDWYYKADFFCLKFLDHQLQYGLNYTHHRLSPNNINASLNQVTYDNAPVYYSHETSVYMNDQWVLTHRLTCNIGLRFTNYIQSGPYTQYALDDNGFVTDSTVYKKNAIIKTYNRLEPRLSAVYQINDYSSVKASYCINQQFIHLASVGSVSIPTDFWIPSTKNIRPQWVTQYTLGYFRNFADNQVETSVEAYYKKMNDQIEFRNGLFNNVNRNAIEENIVRGKGYAFGIEFFVKKNIGKTTGWLSYTLSRTLRQFDEINSGKLYPAKYDRIHDLSITLMHRLNDKWNFSAVFIFFHRQRNDFACRTIYNSGKPG